MNLKSTGESYQGEELLHCEDCDRKYTKHSEYECKMMQQFRIDHKEEMENEESLLSTRTISYIPKVEGHGISNIELNQSLKESIGEGSIRGIFDLRRSVRLLQDDLHDLLKGGLSSENLNDIVTDITIINRWVEDFEKWQRKLEE
jgi:hypothetical protein